MDDQSWVKCIALSVIFCEFITLVKSWLQDIQDTKGFPNEVLLKKYCSSCFYIFTNIAIDTFQGLKDNKHLGPAKLFQYVQNVNQ